MTAAQRLGRYYRIAELAEASGLSKQTWWAMVRSGEVSSARAGRSVLVPEAEARRVFNGWAADAAGVAS